MNELKTIPIDTNYRFYQVSADHKCSVEKLHHCLLVVKSNKENGAILFDPQDGVERLQKAITAIESFLGSRLEQCSVKIVCPETLHSDLLSLLTSLNLAIDPVVVRNGSRVLAEPGRARIMVLPDDIVTSIKKDTPKKVRVVLVDDSATIRHMLKTLLKDDDLIEVVGEADRPSVAANVIRELKPDVVTLDMNMPEKNDAEFVEEMMPAFPVPFVLVTAIGINEGDLVLRALSAGAVDYIQKPSINEVESMRTLLLEKIKTAATAKILPRRQRAQQSLQNGKNSAHLHMPRYSANLIAIGASTGGTEAIRELLVEMPKDSPLIVITQHIPPMFSTAFANRLNAICKIEVREAEDGDMIRPGLALIAPGDKHMQVVKSKNGLCVVLNQMEKVSGHRPSVDVLFRSVVDSGAQHVWGFLLTGMGKDGAEGLKALKNKGHWTAAQDEHSSVVYGMPRVAAEIGATCAIMNLHDLQNLLMNAGNVKKAG